MLTSSILLLALAAETAYGFPFVARMPGVDTRLLHEEYKRQQNPTGPGSEAQCPYNPKHKPANPIKGPYWYNNATNGQQGNQKGGYQVPAPGDKAHEFVAPNYKTDVRGPCPGLNVLANHQFLAHDGITTFNELVDAQQNVYNVGYDLALLLAVLGLSVNDGDPLTMKLSIGCDATNRTSSDPALTGSEPGLDGHNKFEGDTSLTRNDYFLADGDNFSFNGTLFGMMTETTKKNYSLPQLALYRKQRYEQSIAENPDFYYGPLSLLLYGAASFLYELMPSGSRGYAADYATISSFFGAEKSGKTYVFNGKERLPAKWYNRIEPYTDNDVTNQILAMYLEYPVLFGGNTGNGTFDLLTTSDGTFQNGVLTATSPTSLLCFLYQLTTDRIPTSLNGVTTPTVTAIDLALKLLGPRYDNLGCAVPLSK